MNTNWMLALFIGFCLSFSRASFAKLDSTTATRISLGATQNLLASPPLPTLNAGGKWALSPAVGYIAAESEGSYIEPASDPNNLNPTNGYTAHYKGKLSGVTGGLSLTSPTYGRFGFFIFAVGSSMAGAVQAYDGETLVAEFKDLKAFGRGAVGGISYRFLGESNSKFSAGGFIGPGHMYLESSFQASLYIPTGYSPKNDYKINVFSAYTGVQAQWRLNKVLINPYFLFMKELSKTCARVETGLGSSDEMDCQSSFISSNLKLDPDTTFSGFGLFLGYGDLRLNVYSQANLNAAMRDFEYTNYALSYTFGLN